MIVYGLCDMCDNVFGMVGVVYGLYYGGDVYGLVFYGIGVGVGIGQVCCVKCWVCIEVELFGQQVFVFGVDLVCYLVVYWGFWCGKYGQCCWWY